MVFREEEKAGVEEPRNDFRNDAAEGDHDENNSKQKDKRSRKQKLFRQASVGVTGAGLVAIGVAGLHLLATEFETARKAEKQLVDSTKKMRSEIKAKVLETADSVRSEFFDRKVDGAAGKEEEDGGAAAAK